jgi:hypothetical protein
MQDYACRVDYSAQGRRKRPSQFALDSFGEALESKVEVAIVNCARGNLLAQSFEHGSDRITG